MSNTMENNSNVKNESQMVNNDRNGCSAQRREIRIMFDLNEAPPSLDNSQGSNNDNNNEIQIVNNDCNGCSAQWRERRILFDLNEAFPSLDDSQIFVDDCNTAIRGDAKLQVDVEIQQSSPSTFSFPTPPDVEIQQSSTFSFPTPPEGHVAHQDELNANMQNDVSAMLEIQRTRKGKMPMNYPEGARFEEAIVANDEGKAIPNDDEVPDATTSDEESVNGGMLVQHDDVDASGSCLERKRKWDFSENYKPPSTRMAVGPKVLIRVESDENFLDDGYHWRKYGQKETKANPNNPRAYYKCLIASCNCRKQVERDFRNPKYVIVSYEGKHNHEVPITKQRRQNCSTNTTRVVVHENAGMAPPPNELPRAHPFAPFHHYPNYGFTHNHIPYGMNYAGPNNNPFLNMAHNTMHNGTINGQFLLNYYAAGAHVPTPQVGPSIGGSVSFPGLPILPPLSPFDNVSNDRNFLQIDGLGNVASPFRGNTPPTDDQESNDVPPNE